MVDLLPNIQMYMPKHLFITLILILSFYHSLLAQRADIPKLKKLVEKSTSSKEKVDALNRLFFIYIFLNKDSAVYYRDQAMRLATQIKYTKGVAYTQANEGVMQKLAGDYSGAINKYLNSLYVLESLKDEEGISLIYNEIGLVCVDQEHFSLANDFFDKFLKIKFRLKDTIEIGMIYYNLGNLRLKQARINEALAYHYQALKIRQEIQRDTFGIAHSYRCIGEAYVAKGELDSAWIYCQKSIVILNKKRDAFLYSELYSLQGSIYQAQKQYAQALRSYQMALDSATKFSFQQQLQKVYKGMSKCYSDLNQPENARTYLQKYITLHDSLSSINTLEKIIRIKSDYEIAVKEKQILMLENDKIIQEEKLYYRNILLIVFIAFIIVFSILLYLILLFNQRYKKTNELLQEKNKQVLAQKEEMENQRDNFLKANENIKLQNEQIKQQRNDLKNLAENIGNFKDRVKNQRDALQKAYEKINTHRQQIKAQRNDLKRLIETITVYKDKIKAQKERLASMNEEIKTLNDFLESKVQERTNELRGMIDSLSKQNQDLEQFSYIISHNLRAPVARIMGLINIFDKENQKIDFNLQILAHLGKASEDLDTIIRDLTEVISIRNNINMITEKINLETLASETCAYLEEEIQKSNAHIQTHFDVINIYSVRSYVQSIIHNLISNAIKYRSNQRELNIKMKTEYMDSYVCFSIRDNGLGIDLSSTNEYKIFGLYQRLHGHVEGKGMGLFLVKTQIEALNGRVEVESKLHEGTVFRVYFPIKDAKEV